MTQVALDPIVPKSLIEALKTTFSVQATCPLEIISSKVCPVSERTSDVDIVSVLGFQSSTLMGSIALCFPEATFLGVVNQMLGEAYKEITAENSDAAGELLNIIYGSARVKMNQAGHDFKPAIPTVVRGKQVTVNHGGCPTMVKVNCQSPSGLLYLEVSLKRMQAAAIFYLTSVRKGFR